VITDLLRTHEQACTWPIWKETNRKKVIFTSSLGFFNIYPMIMKAVENCSFPVLLVTRILMLKRP